MTGTYKAWLVDGTNRIGASGSEVDWVLQANTSYYRYPDGAIFETTDASGHFNYNGAYNNTLRYPVVFGEVTFSYFTTSLSWTGANSTVWADGGVDCNNWSDGTNGQSGRYGGRSVSTIGEMVSSGLTTTCDGTGTITCVQQ